LPAAENRQAGEKLAVQRPERIVSLAALAFCNFFAIDAHVDGRLDADTNLSAIDCHDGHFDIITNP
jgi:hypothetical protein